VLEDRVMSEIAELLARRKAEGGLSDLQAFHVLALLLRTGRRVNEILMMDFEPLLPLIGPPDQDDRVEGGFVSRPRYQQTKIVTGCGMFATDESHRDELERQLVQTTHLIDQRYAVFEDRYGTAMPADNVWFVGRCREQAALQKVLIALDDVKVRPGAAVRGAGTPDDEETA
jgi:hypothetical protein